MSRYAGQLSDRMAPYSEGNIEALVDLINGIRRISGISQQELAMQMGISRNTISKFLNRRSFNRDGERRYYHRFGNWAGSEYERNSDRYSHLEFLYRGLFGSGKPGSGNDNSQSFGPLQLKKHVVRADFGFGPEYGVELNGVFKNFVGLSFLIRHSQDVVLRHGEFNRGLSVSALFLATEPFSNISQNQSQFFELRVAGSGPRLEAVYQGRAIENAQSLLLYGFENMSDDRIFCVLQANESFEVNVASQSEGLNILDGFVSGTSKSGLAFADRVLVVALERSLTPEKTTLSSSDLWYTETLNAARKYTGFKTPNEALSELSEFCPELTLKHLEGLMGDTNKDQFFRVST